MNKLNQGKVRNFTVFYDNSEEFHAIKNEVFTNQDYYCKLENENPTIVDGGAFIGLTTLFYKQLYPSSHIIAIEPNPENFEILKQNIEVNGLTDVEIYNYALAEGNTPSRGFFIDSSSHHFYSTGSFIKDAWNNQQLTKEIKVECKPLSFFIKNEIDLLKLDIEGAENKVLKSAGKVLIKVKNVIIEYHPVKNNKQDEIFAYLKKAGFDKFELIQDGKPVKPEKIKELTMIYASRS